MQNDVEYRLSEISMRLAIIRKRRQELEREEKELAEASKALIREHFLNGGKKYVGEYRLPGSGLGVRTTFQVIETVRVKADAAMRLREMLRGREDEEEIWERVVEEVPQLREGGLECLLAENVLNAEEVKSLLDVKETSRLITEIYEVEKKYEDDREG